MEYLFVIFAVVFICVVILVREIYSEKKKKADFVRKLYADYGKVPDREYSLERFARLDSYFKRHKREGQLDDITWNDLNFDSIFKRINVCLSAAGEEYLYYRLRTVLYSDDERTHFQALVEYFDNNTDIRVRAQVLMNRLGFTGKYSIYDYLENLDNLGKRSNIKHIAADILYIVCIAVMPFNLSIGIMLTALLMAYNIVTYFREKNEIEPYIVSFAYLVRLLEVIRELRKLDIPLLSGEWETLDKAVAKLDSIRRNSWFVFSGNKYNTSSNPLEILADYIKMVFHIDLIQFNNMLAKVNTGYKETDSLISAIGTVDAAISVASFRQSLSDGWCRPVFNRDKKNIVIHDSYHPLLKGAVKNSIETEKERGILITGSNASGKSTFLRTVGANIVLAQSIGTCTAEYYEAPELMILSSMSLKDDITTGESYYMVEIKSIKRILDISQKYSDKGIVCFVDEVLRGTNTVERIAASTEILTSLVSENVICFAATHDIELTSLLEKRYVNYHFEEEISQGDIYFPYKLMGGRATGANAIKLLDIMGYDSNITRRATLRAQRFVASGKWDMLD
jgi:hypothetical protein